jgi:methionine synthase II (cobalamin-independent)
MVANEIADQKRFEVLRSGKRMLVMRQRAEGLEILTDGGMHTTMMSQSEILQLVRFARALEGKTT